MFLLDWLTALWLKPTAPAAPLPAPKLATPLKLNPTAEVYAYLRLATSEATARKLATPLTQAALRHGLPPLLVARLVVRESGGNAQARSGHCIGLMQVNASLWCKPWENPYRVADNLNAGCRLLARLKRRYPRWEQALTAYNFGENHHVTRRLKTSSYARALLQH